MVKGAEEVQINAMGVQRKKILLPARRLGEGFMEVSCHLGLERCVRLVHMDMREMILTDGLTCTRAWNQESITL